MDPDDDPSSEVAILDSVGDPIAREILVAGAQSPVTARELVEALDLSSTTVYRHLNRLVDRGLVEEVPDVRATETAYRTRLRALLVSVEPSGVSVRHRAETETQAALAALLERVDIVRATVDRDGGELRVALAADEATLRELEAAYRATRRS
jgi:DNA-binding transcriptional ArsR family regulator